MNSIIEKSNAQLMDDGEVILPVQVRNFLKINTGDSITFILDGRSVRIERSKVNNKREMLEAKPYNYENIKRQAGNGVEIDEDSIRRLREGEINEGNI